MARRLPPLNALRAFEAAARHNGFTGAAAELRVSHAAISRHVRALEARLGVTLFRRAGRGVELTVEGLRYLETVSVAFDAIAMATDTLATSKQTKLRVSAHPAFAMRWLIRRLGRFRETHPDCEVVLDATPAVVDLRRGEADLAIRNGEESRPGLARHLLARSRLYPMGARELLPRRRRPLTPTELAALVLLHDEDDGSLWRRWFAANGTAEIDVSRGPRILETGLAIDAALAGHGIVLADDFLVSEELAAGRLVKLCDLPFTAADYDYYLVVSETARDWPPVAAFRGWLLDESAGLRSPG